MSQDSSIDRLDKLLKECEDKMDLIESEMNKLNGFKRCPSCKRYTKRGHVVNIFGHDEYGCWMFK